MPIEKEEFKTGKPRNKLEEDIILFLNERAEKAYTSQEIMSGIEHFATDFTNADIAQMSSFAIADFTSVLNGLVNRGEVTVRAIKGQMFFLPATQDAIRCPKCNAEIAAPKKTWTMTPRPDKLGNVKQLHIGLFECPMHGTFRTVLNKQKTPGT